MAVKCFIIMNYSFILILKNDTTIIKDNNELILNLLQFKNIRHNYHIHYCEYYK